MLNGTGGSALPGVVMFVVVALVGAPAQKAEEERLLSFPAECSEGTRGEGKPLSIA